MEARPPDSEQSMSSRIFTSGGESYMCVIFRAVTERKRTEDALRSSEEYARIDTRRAQTLDAVATFCRARAALRPARDGATEVGDA